eukprot:ANDGO_00958.mRNA.1 JmjC domain-containing protein D
MVDRIDGRSVTQRELYERYVCANRPCILTNMHSQIPMKWTPKFLKKKVGKEAVRVDLGTCHERQVEFKTFLKSLEELEENRVKAEKLRAKEELKGRRGGRSSSTNSGSETTAAPSQAPHAACKAHVPYFRNCHVSNVFPGLLEKKDKCCCFPPHIFGPNWMTDEHNPAKEVIQFPKAWKEWCEMFIGSAGSEFPFIHVDVCNTHAWSAQIYGSKRFIFWAPSDTAFLYPGYGNKPLLSSILDPDNVDLMKFPLFAKATRIECVLQPGEVLFIPSGWWHTARMDQLCVTLGGNFVNGSVWEKFMVDYRELAAKPDPRFRPPTLPKDAAATSQKPRQDASELDKPTAASGAQ